MTLRWKLWEGLETLNFNVMVSAARHTESRALGRPARPPGRRANQMLLKESMPEYVDKVAVKRLCRRSIARHGRFPSSAAFPAAARGNCAPRDAVAWAMRGRRRARRRHIVEDCGVTGIRREGARAAGARDDARDDRRRQTSRPSPVIRLGLAAMAGFRLPIETHVLQRIL